MSTFSLSSIRHPSYLFDQTQWEVWRDVYDGGVYFRDRYLQKLSSSETPTQFRRRKEMTPIPSFAKQAVNEIRNSIFQRLVDIQRVGGSKVYQEAMKSDVDRKRSTMQKFMGNDVLTELLVIGRCGVYVDAPSEVQPTLATEPPSPYLYTYKAEDILSWTMEEREGRGQLKAVLLRDTMLDYYQLATGIALPKGNVTRFRLIYRDVNDRIRVKLFDEKEQPVINNLDEVNGIELDLDEIPFVMLDIGDSLLKDISSYQIALLNLMSGNINFDLSSNIPFLTIQADLRTAGSHLKKPAATTDAGGAVAKGQEENLGASSGRYYDLDTNAPQFISPPTENLISSLKLQENLKDDIRRLVALAVEGKSGSRTESGEAKKVGSQSLEAGLSFIGSVLESAEKSIASIWAKYENFKNPNIAQVAYPESYSFKTDEDRLAIAEKKAAIIDKVPSRKAKKAIYKQVAALLLEDETSVTQLEEMYQEIDSSKVSRSDYEFIVDTHKEGFVSTQAASEALGFAPGEAKQAALDHSKRLERILKSQSKFAGGPSGTGAGPIKNPASRGVPDLDPDTDSGKEEQQKNQE